jgi:hypothetical protein
MANIQQRAGHVMVRIGGNTQETAVLVDSTPDGKVIEKAGMGMANVVSGRLSVRNTGYSFSHSDRLATIGIHYGIAGHDASNLISG